MKNDLRFSLQILHTASSTVYINSNNWDTYANVFTRSFSLTVAHDFITI